MPQGRRSCHSQVVDRYWRPRTGPATRLWPRHPPSRFLPVQKPGFYSGLGPNRDTYSTTIGLWIALPQLKVRGAWIFNTDLGGGLFGEVVTARCCNQHNPRQALRRGR